MSGFAPMTIIERASRLSARQRFFNLVVTNVPGPQIELYLHGKRLIDAFPMVPLAKNQAGGRRAPLLRRGTSTSGSWATTT